MKKPKIIVYHNTILGRRVYIVVFIGQPFDFDLDFDRAREILVQYSSSKYIGIATGKNAITFIERKENIDRPFPTGEELKISKIMLISLPDAKGNLYDISFESEMRLYDLKKAVMFEVEEWYMKEPEHKSSKNINTNSKSSLIDKLFSIFTFISGSNKKSLIDKIEEETLKDLVELEVLKNKKLLLSLYKENTELKKQNKELLETICEANSLIQNILKDRKWVAH